MILISNDFWHKIKMYNFEPYNVFLAIATNIPQRLKTASVLQGHRCQVKSEVKWLRSLLCGSSGRRGSDVRVRLWLLRLCGCGGWAGHGGAAAGSAGVLPGASGETGVLRGQSRGGADPRRGHLLLGLRRAWWARSHPQALPVTSAGTFWLLIYSMMYFLEKAGMTHWHPLPDRKHKH